MDRPNEQCPIHGRDPDEERERRRDDAMWDGPNIPDEHYWGDY
jgi:hypothetical protein